MSFFSKIFGHKKADNGHKASNYTEVSDFVTDNLVDLKRLLSSTGYNDRHRRLTDLAVMCGCHVMLLCQKMTGHDKYMVIETSDRNFAVEDRTFSWQHSQPAASSDASTMLLNLPFPKIGATGFISVPIKNSKNVQTGILLGLSLNTIDNIDAKTRLLHLMAPLFDPEIEVEKLRQGKAQYEQRIVSLRQNIEVMTNDLKIEKEKSAENKELKSIFLTNLSHEIRTPMNVIMGFVDLLETTEDENDKKEFTVIIKQNCDTLLKVIDNLIEISKLQSSYMFKSSTPVQLNDLLDNIKNHTIEKLASLRKSNISVETSYAMETPNDTIWNSEEIITKTLDQLLDNACKYTEEGKIAFGYSFDHKEAIFYVRDTGCGIKNGEEEKIFNMFSVVDNSLTRQITGTGIGLAVAKKYVELANGRVWCDTGYKGGACFYFTIPTEKL
ncbi:MAG: HAMP domain-containing histidine kinase [Bacteroidales bacterium]|nr:HAMP domain-containing histidine kinase [Bacteroidales bacterium]